MKQLITPIFATATLMAAVPAIAATDGETDMMAVCDGALMEADTNKDGMMSEGEIDAFADARFSQLDGNDDGSISREEFVSCMMSERKAEQDKAAAGEEDGTFDVGEWSDISDQDEMSAEDYSKAAEKAQAEDDDKMKRSLARMDEDTADSDESFAHAATQRFKSHDTNGDGIITQSEYETPAVEAEFDQKAMERQFDEKDADDSGGISPQEYRAAATWAHGAVGDDKTAEMSQSSDESAESEPSGQSDDMANQEVLVPVVRYYILTY